MKTIWASAFVIIASGLIIAILSYDAIMMYRDCEAWAAEAAKTGMKVDCDFGLFEPLCIALALGIMMVEVTTRLRTKTKN